jgi:hypothetical protein
LAGALYAEVALVRPHGDFRRAALVRRELTDYLPSRLVRAQRILPALAVAIAVVLPFLSYERTSRSGGDASARSAAIGLAVVAVILGFALERIQRWLIERPQPFSAPDMVAADDAIRSQSVHSLAGAGIAIELLCLAAGFQAIGMSDVHTLRWTMWIAAVLCLFGAIYSCLYYGHRAWRVRRASLTEVRAA